MAAAAKPPPSNSTGHVEVDPSVHIEKVLASWRVANDKSLNGRGGDLKAAPQLDSVEGSSSDNLLGQASNNNGQPDPGDPQSRERTWRRMLRQITTGTTGSHHTEPSLGGRSLNGNGGDGSSSDGRSSPRGNTSPRGGASPRTAASPNGTEGRAGDMTSKLLAKGQGVPTTFAEMFQFNAAVMGVRNLSWQKEVLGSFDSIVRNVANATRLQEECDLVAVRISKIATSQVNLSDFKSCMLAALRSLLPKIWDGTYEVAWSWLWDTVQRLLQGVMGQPPLWERQLESAMLALDERVRYDMRRETYDRFFALAPQGQDYFRQSNTRLHYILSKVMEMTLELYMDPWTISNAVSGIGLRHVGYGIPIEHMGPFVTACVDIFSKATSDEVAVDAYRWSLNLIAKMMVRTIQEGSTIVMKAVNANSEKLLRKAISTAPRAKRAEWMLRIQVGTQQISPLVWAIESGSLEAAGAIIKDLLTIRADRERYYYGADALFARHEDIVSRLVDMGRSLLPVLFEGLIWRSRKTNNGIRRVNYFVRYLILNSEGTLADALKALVKSKDQKMVTHPVVSLVSDTIWTGLVRRQFTLSKIGFLLSLAVFMAVQAILPGGDHAEGRGSRIIILIGRLVNYLFSMSRLAVGHTKQWLHAYDTGHVFLLWGRWRVPAYLRDFYMALSFILMFLLAGMCVNEPMFHCAGSPDWPTEFCSQTPNVMGQYTLLSMAAMMSQWLLLVDMAVFATKLSAFVLVCQHVLSEVGRFLIAMAFLLVTFSSCCACLDHDMADFIDFPKACVSLFCITVGLYEGDFREFSSATVLAVVLCFVTVMVILLLNLLIAQLNCSYEYVYADMVGFARLTRAQLIVDTIAAMPKDRWKRFTDTLHLYDPVEFDEGDVGLPGAIQVKEPASLNPVVVDSVRRYGGTCSPEMQWPEVPQEEEDRFEAIERMMQTAYKQVCSARKGSTREQNLMNSSRLTASSVLSPSESTSSSSTAGGALEDFSSDSLNG